MPSCGGKYREHCGVRRFWGDDEEVGRLVHKPGGAEHARWVFDYDETAEDDDEAGYRFGDHRFRPANMCRCATRTAKCTPSRSPRSNRRPEAARPVRCCDIASRLLTAAHRAERVRRQL